MSGHPEKTPVTPAVQELRSAMERVRMTQEGAGMIINLARYDAETDAINEEFLTGFMSTLPVDPVYRGNDTRDTVANGFSMEDPLDVRIVATFGVFYDSESVFKSTNPALFIIGERPVDHPLAPMTELLLAGWERSVGEDDQWQEPTPFVCTKTVLSDQWSQYRDKAIGSIQDTFSKDVLMSLFSSDEGAFVLRSPASKNFGVLNLMDQYPSSYDRISAKLETKRMRRIQKEYPSHIGCKSTSTRTLRSSDFEDYSVMLHMEYLAAAFGVGEEFDKVKAVREAKMPLHPVETLLDLPDYRQTIEQAVEPSGALGRLPS